MRITALRIENLRNHRETAIELDRVNLIVGFNGSGKSTIRAAIELALTGRVLEWTDRAGRGADNLVRLGAKKAAMELDVEGLGTIRREIPGGLQVAGLTGPSTAQQAVLYERLGAPADVVSAVLNTTEFIRMKPDDQKRMLFDLLGVGFDAGAVREALAKRAPAVIRDAALAQFDAECPSKPGQPGDPGAFERLEKAFRDGRRDAKKALAAAEASLAGLTVPGSPIPADQVAKAQEQLKGLRAQQADLQRRAGQADERRARRERLERELSSLAGPDDSSPEEPPDPGTAEQAAEAAAAEAEKAQVAYNKAQEDVRVAEAGREGIDRQLQGVLKLKGQCPLVPDGQIACPITPAEIARLTKGLRAERDAKAKEMTQLAVLSSRAYNEAAAAQQASAAAKRAALDARAARTLAERRHILAKAAAVQREGLRVEIEALAGGGDANTDELEQLAARIEKGEAMIQSARDAAGALRRQEELQADIATSRARVEALEWLVEAFGPKGLPAEILAARVEPIATKARETLEQLTGGAYTIDISVSGAGDLSITVTHAGLTLPLSHLSTSERMRVGIVLQHVLNSLTGLRLLLVDDAEVLDPGNRVLLMETILAIADAYDTVIVLATRGEVEPRNPGIANLAMFVVEAGQARPLEVRLT